jgi:(p)ppGpp synthase/HD superfamily hydrolase
MSYLTELNQVVHFAFDSHAGQIRKHTHEPYIHHPARVAGLVSVYTRNFDTIAAAWLHDVIEDCGVDGNTIKQMFGDNVLFNVANLTDFPKEVGNRKRRKELYRIRLKKIEQERGPFAPTTLIKLADNIDNMTSIKENDPTFWRVYRHEIEDCLNEIAIHPEFNDHPMVKTIRAYIALPYQK